MAIERRHVIFTGHVQGVFFRATTAEIAAGLPVTGFVRNLDDGTVEMEAQGAAESLDRLVAAIQRRYEVFIAHTKVEHRSAVSGEASFRVVK